MKRERTPSFSLTLRLETEPWQDNILQKRFSIGVHIYNVMVKEARRRIHKFYRDHSYKAIMKSYRKTKKFSSADKKELAQLRAQYGLSEYDFMFYLDAKQNRFSQNIDSFTRQKIASAVWDAVEDCLFDKGEQVHYKKRAQLYSLEGKSNATGIRYRNGHVCWLKLDIPVRIRKRDTYAKDILKNHRIKYCRILRKWHKHKYRYYVQLVMEGIPPQKHKTKSNTAVGIDIGPSTVAVVSHDNILFQELAEEINSIDAQLRRLQRKLDRQRRANNPQNYNEDGTIRRNTKAFRRTWETSGHQKKTLYAIRSLYQKRAEQTNYSHTCLANQILAMGTDIYVEKMQFNNLTKRAKETKISEKTGRYQKKKRFGKSIQNHAPSKLLAIINNKLKYQKKELQKVDTHATKASQFNHITSEYQPCSLSQRWKTLSPGIQVQRDLYSAFLLMNCSSLTEIDIERCFDTFDTFKIQHDQYIETLQNNKKAGKKYPACMGI